MKKYIYILFFILFVFSESVYSESSKFNFDIGLVPFSYMGSYIAISELDSTDYEGAGIYIRNVSGKNGFRHHGSNFLLELIDNGEVINTDNIATPELLKLKGNNGVVEIAYQDKNTLRIRGSGHLRLTSILDESWGIFTIPNVVNPQVDKTFSVISFDNINYQFSLLSGRYEIRNKKVAGRETKVIDIFSQADGIFEIALEEFESGWLPRVYAKKFDQCVIESAKSFSCFENKIPQVPEKYKEVRIYAAYVNWSSFVAPRGFIKRNGMLMSKGSMTYIWSWDHCFNAMALAKELPDLAWDQFMVLYELQDETGAMPDMICPTRIYKGIAKPPIHGWALRKLLEFNKNFLTRDQIKIAFDVLSKQVEFWFRYRDIDRNGIPQYISGCDSGWDNCTVFDSGSYVEGPDLSAYLILQMDILSELAAKLNRYEISKEYKVRADNLLTKMIERLWDNDRFVFREVNSNNYNKESQSLMPYLPIVLGERLPLNIRKKMISNLKNSGLITKYGLATENPSCSSYVPDGYWRGPIWAPSTMIIVDGLNRCGEEKLVKEIVEKFCDMCKKSGFAENFNALTGEPLRDPSYTWTSSVFLILANEYLWRKSYSN